MIPELREYRDKMYEQYVTEDNEENFEGLSEFLNENKDNENDFEEVINDFIDSIPEQLEEASEEPLEQSDIDEHVKQVKKMIQIVLLSIAFENENTPNTIPLLVLCNLFKDSDDSEDVILCAKAIRVASKLGNDKATKMAKEMAINDRINEKVGDKRVLLSSYKPEKMAQQRARGIVISPRNNQNLKKSTVGSTVKQFTIDEVFKTDK